MGTGYESLTIERMGIDNGIECNLYYFVGYQGYNQQF